MSSCQQQSASTHASDSTSVSGLQLLDDREVELALLAMNGGTWDWDLQSNDVRYSDGWLRMLGYERATFPPNYGAWENLLHPEDLPLVVHRVREYLDGMRTNYESEHRLRHKSGQWIWVLDRGRIVSRDAASRPARMIGIEVDITGMKRTEAILRESEERHRMLVENLPEAVFVQHNGVFEYVNPAMVQLLGASSSDEILGRSIWNLIPLEWQGIIRRRIEDMKRTGLPAQPIEIDYHRLDGGTIRIETRAIPYKYKERQEFLIIIRDITKRYLEQQQLKRAYEELDLRVQQRTEELELANRSLRDEIAERKRAEKKLQLFQTAFEHARDAVAILDGSKRPPSVLYVNPAFIRMTGYPPSEILGQTPAGTLFFDDLMSQLVDGAEFLGETIRSRKYGPDFPLEWSASPVRDEWGQISEYVIIQRDITARKLAEEELRRHHEELAHVLRQVTLGEMGTVLAHELNQPLAAITTFTHGVLRRLEAGHPANAEMITALKQVVGQANRAAEIIKRIRGILRKSDAQFKEIDLRELLRDILHLLDTDLRVRKINFSIQVDPGLPPVIGDPIQIEQVLLNLIRNAMHALSEVSAGRLLSIAARKLDNRHVQVEITDNGPGINPDCVEKIFEPFYTSRADGLGMGLSISRTIIETHGGKLWCQMPQSNGAAFHFTLPHGGLKPTAISAMPQ